MMKARYGIILTVLLTIFGLTPRVASAGGVVTTCTQAGLTAALTGGAAARLAAITPPGHKADIHLTLTDDHPWAQAIVLITASPA